MIECAICNEKVDSGFLNTAIGDICHTCIPRYWTTDAYYKRTQYMRETLDRYRMTEEEKDALRNVSR